MLSGGSVREISSVLAAVVPDLVLTCAAVGDHIDHRLTKAAVLDAVAVEDLLIVEVLPVQRSGSLRFHATAV